MGGQFAEERLWLELRKNSHGMWSKADEAPDSQIQATEEGCGDSFSGGF